MPQESRPALEALKRTNKGTIINESSLPKLLVNREEAYQQIEAQIEKGKKLRDREINSEKGLKQAIEDCEDWVEYNKDMLSKLFNDPSIAKTYSTFSYYTYIRLDTENLPRTKYRFNQFRINLDYYIVWVGCHVDHLTNICTQHGINVMPLDTSERIFGDEIFIVHGHNEAAKYKVAKFVKDLDLSETILDEQPSKGQTIIDKFEEHADKAGFAIVLLTADDVGAPKDKKDELNPRARQNVILELGYFLHGLGRERVCVLYEDGVELPSDIHGIVYVSLDNGDGWKLKLAKEMKNIGLPINPDNLL